ncbi:MAG TPA: hypothetical protein PK840_02525 [Bacilli bacterium]|nr:hypothetical protein [Bacilli bacterium]
MKKLKSNQGITLPFTVVIMFFVALLMAALVGYVSLSYQISTRQIRLAEHKIILENVMYYYLTENNLEDGFDDNSLKIIDSYQYLNRYFYLEIEKISYDKLIKMKLKDKSNYINIVLKAELEYSDSGTKIIYKITKWGF